eukprot:CAMPEP_0183381530 /NCGR_PEP_ID=MMETSP0164_2-20130417/126486_1 /TAXON_ID=221442 /ORGANISM="Coccolithus pelagicus ssp braarudi, Strain PLY182g" /LENGTH=55 /DNA_ID=CAMNT_0025559141 /DNA_START=720 /DNA_END=887 /DNA_ORIENTATION=-
MQDFGAAWTLCYIVHRGYGAGIVHVSAHGQEAAQSMERTLWCTIQSCALLEASTY